MHYDSIFDKWHEECGVFGIYDRTVPIVNYIYWGLFALQHRGQESAGIAVGDSETIRLTKGMGLVTEAFRQLPDFKGHVGCGHVRYSTTGSNNPQNIQPLSVRFRGGQIAVAHNGNLVNALQLREELEMDRSIFQTTMDSEVIVNLIARSRKENVLDRIKEAARRVHGAFSLVMCTPSCLIGLRDPHGYRPLALGKTSTGGYVLSSETCAFSFMKAEFVRHIEAGEMVWIDDEGVHSTYYMDDACPKSLCVFEYIYFARGDSNIDGKSVYQSRLAMGRQLAKEAQFEADIVMGIPDSGTTAAHGYSQESGISFAEGLVKNRYMGRTFIKPDQAQRDLAVRMKLSPVPSVLKGKRVILVDDSIVRGTTSGIIVKMLREAGASEVYMAACSPPIEFPCHYGIDTSARKELIAATHTVEEIRQYIGADKLHYLSQEGLCEAMEPIDRASLCFSCFDGKYNTELSEGSSEGAKFALENKY